MGDRFCRVLPIYEEEAAFPAGNCSKLLTDSAHSVLTSSPFNDEHRAPNMKKIESFSELGLAPALSAALEALEFKTPTPIQAAAIPHALLGKDILAIAPTGTGKTGAFGIPVVSFLYPQPGKQVLILAPTRELAAQIHRFLRKLGDSLDLHSVLIVGGESYSRQRNLVKRGVDYIIATPGRLMDHIQQGMPTEKIAVLVLDEVDRMLDMGFAPQVEEIVQRLQPERQTYLFSATLPPEIVGLANKYLKDPVRVNVVGNPAEAPKIHEERIDTDDEKKPALLVEQVTARTGKIIVFANTQGRVEQVARRLEGAGHPASCIHGGRTHRERKAALEAFRSGEVRVLVATDIVARGIDVADIEHVINYDYPATKEDYLHRIGRTGRIGKEGSAVTFVDAKRKRRSDRQERWSNRSQSAPQRRSAPRPHSAGQEGFRESRPFRPERPFEKRQGFQPRKPFRQENSDRPFENDKAPFRPRGFKAAQRPAFGGGPSESPRFERKEGKPPWRSNGERPAFEGRRERPSFGDRGPKFGARGDRPAFEGRREKPAFGDRGPKFGARGDRPRFGNPSERPRFERPAFNRSEEGPRKVGGTRAFRAGEESGRPAPAPRRAFSPHSKPNARGPKASPNFVRSGSGGAVRRGGRRPSAGGAHQEIDAR
jgi:ATP-dependent RNA helicase RhlE